MRVRLMAILTGVALLWSLIDAPVAFAQPVNSGAGASRTREGAMVDARSGGGGRNFADTSQAGGGSGGRRQYRCEWYREFGDGDDDSTTDASVIREWYDQLGFTPPEVMHVQVRCFDTETGQQAEWSIPTEDNDNLAPWSPGVTEPVPDVDPEELAMEAIDELTFPVPNGRTSPPLDSGSYAQLPTYFEVNDWVTLTASASAGPVTSTVTATPTNLEIVLLDSSGNWWTGERQVLGDAQCSEGGTIAAGSSCVWTPDHSSAGQATRHPDTGEPCFEVVVLVEWSLTWTVAGADGGGTLPSAWMGSSACIVVAEIQAVVDDG